jgi:hypothetical protein
MCLSSRRASVKSRRGRRKLTTISEETDAEAARRRELLHHAVRTMAMALPVLRECKDAGLPVSLDLAVDTQNLTDRAVRGTLVCPRLETEPLDSDGDDNLPHYDVWVFGSREDNGLFHAKIFPGGSTPNMSDTDSAHPWSIQWSATPGGPGVGGAKFHEELTKAILRHQVHRLDTQGTTFKL